MIFACIFISREVIESPGALERGDGDGNHSNMLSNNQQSPPMSPSQQHEDSVSRYCFPVMDLLMPKKKWEHSSIYFLVHLSCVIFIVALWKSTTAFLELIWVCSQCACLLNQSGWKEFLKFVSLLCSVGYLVNYGCLNYEMCWIIKDVRIFPRMANVVSKRYH